MDDTLKELIAICELDRDLHDMREQLELYPRMLRELDKKNEAVEAREAAARKSHDDARETRRKSELEVAALREKINKYLGQQGMVKTNKEYDAINDEIAGVKSKIDDQDTIGLESLETEEEATSEIEEIGKERARIAEQTSVERERINGRIEEKKGNLTAGEAERVERLGRLPEETREMYELLNEGYPGTAVVAVVEGACGGCHMTLNNYNISSARALKPEARCDQCKRIIYDRVRADAEMA